MADGLKRVLDYSDYLATPDDGKRYEIIGGHRLSQAGAYERLFDATGDTVLVHPDFEGLEVDLSRLWMESGRR